MRVLVVGTGLIGGSVGMALRRAGTATVVGFDRSPDVARHALEAGAADEIVADPGPAAADVALIVVATPVGQIVPTIELLSEHARDGTVVTDVGSTKGPVVAAAEGVLGASRPFVGGHPMAGTEGEGVDAARADLFEGALWILTPTSRTDPAAYRTVNALIGKLGAHTLALDAAEHDRLVALVSHLPYALATTLAELAGREGDDRVFQAAAGSFRDLTRTAGSNPGVWRDILTTNREALLAEIDAFAASLDRLRDALDHERWDEIAATIDAAREARRRLPLKGERAPARPVTVEVFVPDRAGVLAEVTRAVGEEGINIEDLWMEHTPSGGTVRLVVDGTDAATRAADLLGTRGFHAAVLEER